TQAGKSALPWDHHLNMGAIGVTGSLASNKLAKNADLVIAIGTRLSDFTTSSKLAFENSDVEFLNINVSNFYSFKLDSLSIVSDAKLALSSLSKRLKESDYKNTYTSTYLSELKSEWDNIVDSYYSQEVSNGLSQTR